MEQRTVIIVGGGSGTRMGKAVPKQFLLLGGEPVLSRSVKTFVRALPGAAIVVALPECWMALWEEQRRTYDVPPHTVCRGGATRFESVLHALAHIPDSARWIGVHDAVRPLVSIKTILSTFDWAERHGSAVPAVAPADSFRMLDGTGSHPVDRSRLRAVQTPQVFRAERLRSAYASAAADPEGYTDDASVVEAAGESVSLCEGDPRNTKLTTPWDLEWAEAVLRK